jgi:hypothetical protein
MCRKNPTNRYSIPRPKDSNNGLGSAAPTATPATVELPGVDGGGEVRNLRPTSEATIPSDGRPYRVPIFSLSSEATVEYVLMPEVSCQVVLKSEQASLVYKVSAAPEV